MTKRVERILAILAFLVIIAAFINFIVYLSISRNLGGDALNGYQKDGRFYLSTRSIDEIDKEVPEATWRQARLHGESVFATGVLAMFSLAYLLLRYVFPAIMFGGNHDRRKEERQKTVEEVRASGPPIASLMCSGRIGGGYISGPLIEVDIHPLGISISTMFNSPCAVKAEQIRQVRYRRGILSQVVEITHTSRDISGSVLLNRVKVDSDFAMALNALVGPECVSVAE